MKSIATFLLVLFAVSAFSQGIIKRRPSTPDQAARDSITQHRVELDLKATIEALDDTASALRDDLAGAGGLADTAENLRTDLARKSEMNTTDKRHSDSLATVAEVNLTQSDSLKAEAELNDSQETAIGLKATATDMNTADSRHSDSLATVANRNLTQSDSLKSAHTTLLTKADTSSFQRDRAIVLIDNTGAPDDYDTINVALKDVDYRFIVGGDGYLVLTGAAVGVHNRFYIKVHSQGGYTLTWKDDASGYYWLPANEAGIPAVTQNMAAFYWVTVEDTAVYVEKGEEYENIFYEPVGPDVTPPVRPTIAAVSQTTLSATIKVDTLQDDDVSVVWFKYDETTIGDKTITIEGSEVPTYTATTQRGTATALSGTSSLLIDVPTPYDSNITDLDVEIVCADSQMGRTLYTVEPYSSTQIKVCFGTTLNQNWTASWWVHTDSALTVEWFRATANTGTQNPTVDLSGVKDTAKTWLEVRGRVAANVDVTGGNMNKVTFSDSNTVLINTNAGGTNLYLVGKAVTYDSCVVTSYGFNLSSSETLDSVTAASSAQNKRALRISYTSTGTTNNTTLQRNGVMAWSPTGTSTKVYLQRGVATSTITGNVFDIRFTDGTTVNWLNLPLAGSTADTTFNPGVTMARASHYSTSYSAEATDNMSKGKLRVSLVSNTVGTATRTTSATAMDAWLQVIEWNSIKLLGEGAVTVQKSWDDAAGSYRETVTGVTSGDVVTVAVPNLSAGTTYSFAAKLEDANGNVSEQSASISVTTLTDPPGTTAQTNLARKPWALGLDKVKMTDLAHPSIDNPDNEIWESQTINLTSSKNQTVSWQMVYTAGASAVDSVAVFITELVIEGGGDTIKNLSADYYNWDSVAINGYRLEDYTLTQRSKFSPLASTQSWWTHFRQLDNYPQEFYPTRTVDTSSFNGKIPWMAIQLQTPRGTFSGGGQGGNYFDVAANENEITFHEIVVKRTKTAGVYTGNFIVTEDLDTTFIIPIILTVRNVTLPDTGMIENAWHVNFADLIRYNGGIAPYGATYWTERRKLEQQAWQHGVNLVEFGYAGLSSNHVSSEAEASNQSFDVNLTRKYAASNNWFSSAFGYDGWLMGASPKKIFVGPYGGPGKSCDEKDDSYQANENRWTDNETQADLVAAGWLDFLTDSSLTQNVFMCPMDEPYTVGGEACVHHISFVDTRLSWLKNNSAGIEARVKTWGTFPILYHPTEFRDDVDLWVVTGPVHDLADGWSWNNARALARQAAGVEVGIYNFGGPGSTNFVLADGHLAHASNFAWLVNRNNIHPTYASPQFFLNWHTDLWIDKFKQSRQNQWTTLGSTARVNGDAHHIMAGQDTTFSGAQDRDYDGYYFSLALKAWREAQIVYKHIQMANELDIDISDLEDDLNVNGFEMPDPTASPALGGPPPYLKNYSKLVWNQWSHAHRAALDEIRRRIEAAQ